MSAVDYASCEGLKGFDRLLFVAHREEILDQSRTRLLDTGLCKV
jgi:hypothetical protein